MTKIADKRIEKKKKIEQENYYKITPYGHLFSVQKWKIL